MTRGALVRASLLALALFAALPRVTFAQSAITGVVKDTSGAILPGVTVEASSAALIEKARSAVSDGEGVYRIIDLRPGVYAVTFSLSGFNTIRRDGIDLPASFTATVNVEMQVGSVEETITVSGQAPLVDVTNSAAQMVLSRDVIDALPAARIATALTSLLPGVQTLGLGDPVGRQQLSIAIHGSRSGEQTTTIDGFSNRMARGPGGATSTFYNNQASVQEISVQTSGGNAEQQFAGIWTNIIPKEGGNNLTGYLFASYASHGLASSNLNDDLRSRGIKDVAGLKKLWDIDPAIGGRLIKDRLWFYSSYRASLVSQYRAGIYYNLDPLGYTYQPDYSRPSFVTVTDGDYNTRLTWQLTPRNKIALYYDLQPHVVRHRNFDSLTSPEATNYTPYQPNYFTQGVWKSPVTSRLMLEAGIGGTNIDYNTRLQSGQEKGLVVVPGTMSFTEQSTGMIYRAPLIPTSDLSPAHHRNGQYTMKGAATYVTGSHAIKAGFHMLKGSVTDTYTYGDIQATLLNGAPRSLTLAATPIQNTGRVNHEIGAYVQDQWTIRRLTVNLGVRYDELNDQTDAVDLPAGRFVTARSFPAVKNVPNWNDINPRFGASYDLFGDGRTAVKGSLNRYVQGVGGSGLTQDNHPVNTSVVTTTRTWTDNNHDFIIDCDLTDPLLNGECGQVSNLNFGKNNPHATTYDPRVLSGWGVRNYNWETSAALQRELGRSTSATVAYYRRWYGNVTATHNLDVTPADFDPFCITPPADSRLPDGGGKKLCGYYDVSQAKYGHVDNYITLRSKNNFGVMTEVYTGVDLTLNARFPRGAQISGGMSLGRTATNTCAVVDSPQESLFCAVTPPFQPNIKAQGVYPLPWYGLQLSAALQNVPGAPITANYTATNAEVTSSLGRTLSSGMNGTVVVPIIQPGTLFEHRETQLDLRFSKRFTVQKTRILGSLDVFNFLNRAGIDAVNTNYGGQWLRPTRIQGPRYVKFSAQVDF
jgi:carboxypeptidase family protein/TonB-dependent receptor-like protein